MTDRWNTLPGWGTAHSLVQYGSLGAIRLWITVCGRDYCTPDHEVDDEPIPAPDDMPRCNRCEHGIALHTEGASS